MKIMPLFRFKNFALSHDDTCSKRRGATIAIGVCLRPDAPEEWTAPNGVRVYANPDGWNGSFHDARYDTEGVWVVAYHRHLGPSRRAVRAYLEQFGVDPSCERQRLQALVREGD